MYEPRPLGAEAGKRVEARLKISSRALTSVLLGAITALGALLRFANIGGESYWRDEVTMVTVAGTSVPAIIDMADGGGGRPPAYVLLAHFWMQLFGTSEAATRSLSALLGTLAIIVLYLIGRELFGSPVGLVSAFFMAVAEVQIQQSQNFRYYSLLVLVTLLSFLFYILALKNGRLLYFAFYVASTIAMYFTHSFGVFSIAAQGLYFIITLKNHRKLIVPWLISQVVILAAIAPGLLLSFTKTSSGTSPVMDWIGDPTLKDLALTIIRYISAGNPGTTGLVVAALFLVVGGAVYVARTGTAAWLESLKRLPGEVGGLLRGKWRSLALTVCWLLCPVLIPFVLSQVFGPVFLERYTIGASSALYLLLGAGIVAVRRVAPEFLTLSLAAILLAPGLYDYYVSPGNEQWREAAAYIQENEKPGDAVVFAPGQTDSMRTFAWYYRGALPANRPGCELSSELQTNQEIAGGLQACVGDAGRFWLVLGSYGRPQNFERFFITERPADLRLAQEQPFKDLTVYLFER